MITRRRFLAASASLAVAAKRTSASPHGLPIGLQLYTIGDALGRDFEGTLSAVAAMGYRAVEGNLSLRGHDAKALKSIYDGLGLAWRSAHCGGDELRGGLDKTIETAHAVGLAYLVCPFPLIPNTIGDVIKGITLDDWKANAELFNRLGERMRAAGITFAYHNHNIDFRQYGGVSGYDTLIAGTDPGLVKLELDCGWMVSAGVDPVDYFGRYPDRYVMLHLKDLARDHIPNTDLKMASATLGRGIVDWPRLLAAAERTSVNALYVEQEPPYVPSSLGAVRDSFDYLNGLRL
jgi:sugar phosphate isomerase/epimerase